MSDFVLVSGTRQSSSSSVCADYEKSIELGATADGCSCEPHDPLVALYVGVSRQYDKGWDVVHKAQKFKIWIAPELLEKLKKDSGRNN
jgi:hypothetical protein